MLPACGMDVSSHGLLFGTQCVAKVVITVGWGLSLSHPIKEAENASPIKLRFRSKVVFFFPLTMSLSSLKVTPW